MSNNDLYQQKQFLLMTLDPVHVGTGGYRLGRVDNSIVREPGTRLPKIPGTALHGAIRQYAAYTYGSPRCAGQGVENKESEGHCKDRKKCPICHTFGYLKGQADGRSGVVNIGDARLLLFPVHSLAGPVWVTSPGVLRDVGCGKISVADDKVRLASGLKNHQHLNLGWLMLPKEDTDFDLTESKVKMSESIPRDICERAVLVTDKLFSQVVNSNLEVRTSVSINPKTGAADSGALFTYEAIPRAALLWTDVVQDNYHPENFPETKENKIGKLLGKTWDTPMDVVRAGLRLGEHLGIGGMGTRGFGRIRLLNSEEAL